MPNREEGVGLVREQDYRPDDQMSTIVCGAARRTQAGRRIMSPSAPHTYKRTRNDSRESPGGAGVEEQPAYGRGLTS